MKSVALLILSVTTTLALTTAYAKVKVKCPTYKQMNSAFRHSHDCKTDGYCAKKINGHSFQIAAVNCEKNCEFQGFKQLQGATIDNNYLHCFYESAGDTHWQSSSTYQIGSDCSIACNEGSEADLNIGMHNRPKVCIATCKQAKKIQLPKSE